MHVHRLTLLALTALITSCGAAPKPAPPAPAPASDQSRATDTAAASTLPDRDWSQVVLPRAALSLSLPDRPAWRSIKSTGWLKLDHRPSASRIELGQSRAPRPARPETCEANARIQRPDLPRFAEEELLDRRNLRTNSEFLIDVSVAVREISPNELEAHVLAFGANIGHCLALHFTTRTTGTGLAQEAARRLALIVDRVLPSITLTAVEDRVAPQPFENQ